MKNPKIIELIDGHYYYTDSNFVFELDDGKRRQFGLHIEVINMDDATGEKEYKHYPFLVSFNIVADKCHKSFDETNDKKPSKYSLIYDCISYMGGIPVDHILTHATKNSVEGEGEAWDILTKLFSVKEAMIRTEPAQFGTIAAQNGKGAEHSWFQFKTYEACEKFIEYLIKHRTGVLSLVGFILDRPINLMGETGWSLIEKQVKGCKSNRKRA